MGLKKRIIAKLLIESTDTGYVAVKYRRFTDDRRIVGDPVALMRTAEDQKLDEFYICFLGAVDPAFTARMTEAAFCPVTVAGGINTMEQVDALMRDCGVEKVVVKHDTLGWEIAARYGQQAVVYSHDYRGAAPGVSPPDWAGEILLTSIDRDGVGAGMDIDALRHAYKIPVVLAGGVGKLAHVKAAFDAGADGVAVSSMFAFSDRGPIKLRSWLVSSGCNVRG